MSKRRRKPRAGEIADMGGILAEGMSEVTRGPIDRDFAKIVRKIQEQERNSPAE